MSNIFDGLASIFVEHLGQPVVYTPKATGIPKTINAIPRVEPQLVDLGQAGPSHDTVRRLLDFNLADIANPAEGDGVTIDGEAFTVVPPIAPDGKGMVSVTLEAAS